MSLLKMEVPACLNLRWKYRMQARITAECSVSIQMLPTRKALQCLFAYQLHRLQHEPLRTVRILVVTGKPANGKFQAENGMRINTYGEYDKDGWKFPTTRHAWEKNNFKGAFEMKSSNGAFGIRIEVQQGNRTPF